MASTTSSFRVSAELKERLERTAKFMGIPKNKIVSEALIDYLNRHDRAAIQAEADRQMALLAANPDPELDAWLEAMTAEVWADLGDPEGMY